MLELLFQLLLKDLQSLVLQLKLLCLGNLSQRASERNTLVIAQSTAIKPAWTNGVRAGSSNELNCGAQVHLGLVFNVLKQFLRLPLF